MRNLHYLIGIALILSCTWVAATLDFSKVETTGLFLMCILGIIIGILTIIIGYNINKE